jgi:hypothetical protein
MVEGKRPRGRPPWKNKDREKFKFFTSSAEEEAKNDRPLVDSLDNVRKNKMRKSPEWFGPPTDQEREIVYSYACFGATDEDIGTVLKMGHSSLHKWFSEELKEGRANAKSKIAQRLYQVAIGAEEMKDKTGKVIRQERKPNLSALIFLAKTRLGWKETQIIESNELKTSVQILIPHNNRMDPPKQDTIVQLPIADIAPEQKD